MEKEYLYVGHYIDILDRYILKIGTTKDLDRRAKEHTYNYRKAKEYTMPADARFEYDWAIPLSRYNTHRYEDRNIDLWKEMGFGEYVRNDRFCCAEKPEAVVITIRKEYVVVL